MLKIPYTIYCWMAVIIGFISFTITGLIFWPFFKEKQKQYYALASFFIRLLFTVTGIKVEIHGSEQLPKENIILVSNHQSLIDIFVLMAYFPKQITFFAKKELKNVPILGFNIVQMGHVLVDRAEGRKALKQLDIIKDKLIEGKSIIIFPEGTRSKDGKIGPFKKGAFLLAHDTKKVLIPCYIKGSGKTLPKNKLWITPAKISIHLHAEVKNDSSKAEKKPIAINNMKDETREILLTTQTKVETA
ncbi:MAG: 1-acyl-sn-glycerol-3-phosphate acyltransferase [Rickettsiales bacterium]|nr:1-acyl-sn-glycerol-3-phosphate acyltransferase [Rickettsiales bacterium]